MRRVIERTCSACLGNQALILQDRGDLDGAMALQKEQERICRELGNKDVACQPPSATRR